MLTCWGVNTKDSFRSCFEFKDLTNIYIEYSKVSFS